MTFTKCQKKGVDKLKQALWVSALCLSVTVLFFLSAGCGDTSGSSKTEDGYEDLIFELNADGASYSISGMGSCRSRRVEIPAAHRGLPVKEIMDGAFKGRSDLLSVTVPDGVTRIGAEAFYGCKALVSADLPDSVTSIGERAFYGCASLTSIQIPSGVKKIEDSAFYSCRSLRYAVIPDGVTAIGYRAFESCGELLSINVPESVSEIGRSAFEGCGRLSSVFLPRSVTSIGARAFQECRSARIYCEAEEEPKGWEDGWYGDPIGEFPAVHWNS